ncbi:hypothetical protein Sjap_014339 [Stephania japonica]|uniref:Alpha-1,3/1,6-mannosyltransferase ALG2 n=1 Tax=Stephania japonica TaxID=461633 RepID=A0AAP0IZG7_9MAGN
MNAFSIGISRVSDFYSDLESPISVREVVDRIASRRAAPHQAPEEMREKGSGKESSKLNIAIIHPDLGIGKVVELLFSKLIMLPFSIDDALFRCLFVALCVLLLWPSFDVILADQVSVIVPLLKAKKSSKVVFYCHFPDLLLAQHTTVLRKIYRKPIDLIEEATTGMADLILVNSKFTALTFAKTFRRLDGRGIRPSVLYPAFNVEQFENPCANKKKNIGLAISSLVKLLALEGDAFQNSELAKVSLVIAGGFDKRLRDNVEHLEELKSVAEKEGVSDRINYITSCSTAERNKLLSQFKPMYDEHFGIVPLEAMAAHKPVIACNSGGPVETKKDGVTGFLCEPNAQEFSSAMAMAKLVEYAQEFSSRRHVSEAFSTEEQDLMGGYALRYSSA